MLKRRSLLALGVGVIALAVIGCGGGQQDELILQFSGLQPLANGHHYEGWALIGGKPVTTGKFNVDANGAIIDLKGRRIKDGAFKTGLDLSKASAIVLTIEPAGDTDALPSNVHYLAGEASGGRANLTVAHGAALGNDFTTAAGKYILATPTDGANSNETAGIWWFDRDASSPVALRLPTLPAGWVYEGWVVINGRPVTTGTFTDPAKADDAAPYSGAGSSPAVPGEDFLKNAPAGLAFPADIRGGTAVVSIEPSPDDSPAPFTLKPLVGAIPADAKDHTVYQMNNQAGGFPNGTASIR